MKTAIIEKCLALLIVIGEIICKFLETRNADTIKKASLDAVENELSLLTDGNYSIPPREFS